MIRLVTSRINKAILVVFALTTGMISCTDHYLDEVPYDFLSPENTFTTNIVFESGIANLYRVSRLFGQPQRLPGMVGGAETDKALTILYASGTDLGWYWDKKTYFGDYATVSSFDPVVQNFWIQCFSLIKDANVILTRSEAAEANWDSEDDKLLIQAEARFFRALAYRYAVYLFGGVPIIEEELIGPKLDFVRNSKAEVLDFIIAEDRKSTRLNSSH